MFNWEEWIKQFDTDEISMMVGRFQEKYHNVPVVDIKKELSQKSIDIIKKLGIEIEEKIYTEYEFDVLDGKIFDYYEYEGIEDKSYLKSLDGTGVTQKEVADVENEMFQIFKAHNF